MGLCDTEHEFEWEAEARDGKLIVKAWCNELRKPVKHSSSLQQARQHPDGIEGYATEKARKLLSKRLKSKEEERASEVPSGGTAKVRPDDELDDDRPPSERPGNN